MCSFSCLSLCSKFIEEPTKGVIVLVFKFEFIVCLCLGGQGKKNVNPKSKNAFYAHLQFKVFNVLAFHFNKAKMMHVEEKN